MTYGLNIFEFAKELIPKFLRGVTTSTVWIEPGGQSWITAEGQPWGFLANSRHLDWVESWLEGLQFVNNMFDECALETKYLMSLTGQVIYLEQYLNDLFDPVLRRIYIDDGSLTLPPYLYNIADDHEPVWYLYNIADGEPPFYLYNQEDFNTAGEFIVFVPAAIILTPLLIAQITAAVLRYKQAGARFKIQSY
jgi:hypothetical protein